MLLCTVSNLTLSAQMAEAEATGGDATLQPVDAGQKAAAEPIPGVAPRKVKGRVADVAEQRVRSAGSMRSLLSMSSITSRLYAGIRFAIVRQYPIKLSIPFGGYA